MTKSTLPSSEPHDPPAHASHGLAGIPKDQALRMYRRMQEIRQFEEKVYYLFLQGEMPGTLHLCIGQEACAVGVCENLQREDFITATHRPHGHALAKGVSLKAMMAELFATTDGCAGGYGGSMHVGDISVGCLPAIAIVGAGVPVATGVGLAFKMRRTDNVVCCFLGDGAVNEGAFHEGVNMAAIWDLPVVFVCENNLYGASTHISLVTKLERLSDRADGYGIPAATVNGMDVVAVYQEVGKAVDRARQGQGPTFVVCETYRFCGHSRSDARNYRTREEEGEWKRRDPLLLMEDQFASSGLATEQEVNGVRESVTQAIDEAVEFARSGSSPQPEDCLRHVFCEGGGGAVQDAVCHRPSTPIEAQLSCPDGSSVVGFRRSDADRATQCPSKTENPQPTTSSAAKTQRMTIAEALRDAIRLEMRRDERVFCIGEDIGITGGFGGAFTVTLGLSDEFGHERILDTPISEIGIAGAAVGSALAGMRPIADVQYADFIFCMMDQLVNQAAKMTYMSGGKVSVPMVMRVPSGATTRGSQHGQSPESFFIHVPGLKVACPSTAYDAKGLLITAIRDDNPVLFFEHKLLYGSKGMRAEKDALSPIGEVPEGEYTIPFGKGVVRRPGEQVTIVAKLLMVYRALAAADILAEDGISCEVIDPRTLVPFDVDLVLGSVRKTGRLVIVDECNRTGGWAGEVAAEIQDRAFDYLDAPIKRVTAPDSPVPFAPAMERFYVPDEDDIVAAVKEVI